MDYMKWSLEYAEEAKKVLRNIEKLKKMEATVRGDERQTLLKDIITLRGIYNELIETSGYLHKRAKELERSVA